MKKWLTYAASSVITSPWVNTSVAAMGLQVRLRADTMPARQLEQSGGALSSSSSSKTLTSPVSPHPRLQERQREPQRRRNCRAFRRSGSRASTMEAAPSPSQPRPIGSGQIRCPPDSWSRVEARHHPHRHLRPKTKRPRFYRAFGETSIDGAGRRSHGREGGRCMQDK